MLLRTSVLDRIHGDLADALTGAQGSERILQDLEEASEFVVSLDAQRIWFRYHSLFGDLLRIELRRTAAGGLYAPHAAAADLDTSTAIRWRRSAMPSRPNAT